MIGSLDEDKSADFIVVDGNPVVDIALLRAPDRICRVVLNGKTMLDRDASRVLIAAGFFPRRKMQDICKRPR